MPKAYYCFKKGIRTFFTSIYKNAHLDLRVVVGQSKLVKNNSTINMLRTKKTKYMYGKD